MRSAARLLSAACALLFALAAAVFAHLGHARWNLPYNESGNYFDGTAVLNEQAVAVYALCAAAALGLAGACVLLFRRLA